MGKKIIVILLALLALNMASAQVLYLDTELSTHFDNTEHTGSDVGQSRTIFAVRATPTLGYRFDNHHSIVIGTELLKDFGSVNYMDRAKFVAYYQFENGKYGANAGIFQRNKLVGEYSRAFYSDAYHIYNDMVQGVALRRTGKRGFAEIAVDWDGLYSPESREKFRVLVAGGGRICKHPLCWSVILYATLCKQVYILRQCGRQSVAQSILWSKVHRLFGFQLPPWCTNFAAARPPN